MTFLDNAILKIFIFFIALSPVTCFAQYSISGKLLNHADGKPVADASVFLANATIGSKAGDDGTFTLRAVKPGKYRLIVSIVGFETYSQNLMINDNNIILPDIQLVPQIKTIKEVVIRVDPNRERNLEWFTDEFLGTSPLARDCKIINPEILNLDYDDAEGVLTASSCGEFLVIENNALGYKINYLLTDFKLNNKDRTAKEIHYDGTVLFKEMAGSATQKQKWLDNRQEVYRNSTMHFLRSLINDKVAEEGFKVQQLSIYKNPEKPNEALIQTKMDRYGDTKLNIPNRRDSLAYWIRKAKLPAALQKLMKFSLNREEILRPSAKRGLYMFGCDNDALYITYNKDRHTHIYNRYDRLDGTNSETTIVNFTKPFALVDSKGEAIDPGDLVFSGAWSVKRIAELLPVDYEPAQESESIVDSTIARKINKTLNTFLTYHATEKAYLQFDKPYYAAGDTMYFKAYVTDEAKHMLSKVSQVLYVDLVSDKGKTDQSIKLQLINGVAWGDFALPDSLSKMNYTVRAHTRLMQNNEKAGSFERCVPIAQVKNLRIPESGKERPQQTLNRKADIQFLPEGGNLVIGVRSKVAFKATGANGLGVAVKGIVVDNANKQVCSFASVHLGMGYFYVEPLENKTYKAMMTYADGSQNSVDLPTSAENGITLSINNELPTKTKVSLQASKAWYKANKDKDYILLIYSGGTTTTLICKLKGPTVIVNLEKGEFPSGIARITLFSPVGEPLAERLLFVKNDDLLNLKIGTDKLAYHRREKVKIDLKAGKQGEMPASGHFSVSVIDESQAPQYENYENTILTNLLLTSDLKGYVEQPNYYFTPASDEVNNNLDLLMLTNGYRRFEWRQVLENKPIEALAWQPEKALELSGVVKTASGKVVPYGEITLIATSNNLVKDTVTDINGNFKFTELNITDNTTVVLRARKENKGENVRIEVKQPEQSAFVELNNPELSNTEMPPEAVALMRQKFVETGGGKAKTLKEVNIKAYKSPTKPVVEHSANLNGPGHANTVIMADQLVGCQDITCLFGKLPGMVSKGGMLYLIRTGERLGEKNHPEYVPKVAIFIDGMYIPQTSDPFSMLNIKDIYSIEVLTSGSYLALYGSSAEGGALIITTKRGGEGGNKPIATASGLISFPFKGFYKARDFYSPKYTYQDNNASRKDLRSTIYWNPELLTDKEGNASFEYFNTDGHGSYRVVVEGIDEHGNLGRQVYHYSVE